MTEQATESVRERAKASAEPRLATLVACVGPRGCPIGTDIPALARALRQHDFVAARRIATAINPFASSCGHGCHAPCESACVRGNEGRPVSISRLEAFAARAELQAGGVPSFQPARLLGAAPLLSVDALAHVRIDRGGPDAQLRPSVAIVGAGAAGLSCAHDLSRLGYACTVFDAATEPGGILTGGVPALRFPVGDVRDDCARVLERGIDYRPQSAITSGRGARELLARGYAAVFVAIGASRGARADEPIEGAAHLLRDAMLALQAPPVGATRIVVIGDDELALDAARVSMDVSRRISGVSASVSLVLGCSLEHARAPAAWIAAAIREGVTVYHDWRLVSVVAERSGALNSVGVKRGDGRASRQLAADVVYIAPPREPAAHEFDDALARDGSGFIAVDPETLETSIAHVWAGGACAFGHRSIAHAVADGKRAAWQIHSALSDGAIVVHHRATWVEVEEDEASHILDAAERESELRVAAAAAPASSNASSELALLAEASRCLDCNIAPVIDEATCTGCGKCVEHCEPRALSVVGAVAVLDASMCTRCGDCVQACPTGAITMLRAESLCRIARSEPADRRA